MTRTKLVLFMLLAAMTAKTMAQIELRVATSSDIKAAYDSIKTQIPSECEFPCGSWEDPTDQSINCVSDPNGICSNWGANQYRYNGFLALKNGHFPFYRNCIADINDETGGTRPFLEGLVFYLEDYIVYGKAENFTVPEDGDYSFWVRQHLQLFIFIDGKLVDNAKDGDQQILANYDGEVIGQVDLEDSLLATSRTAYQTHGVNLTAGTHTFEIYYSADKEGTEQQAKLYWQTPSMRTEDPTSWQIIPAQVYGGTLCPEPPVVELTTVKRGDTLLLENDTACLEDTVEYTLTAQLLNQPEWAENVEYVWDMFDPDPNSGKIVTDEPTVTYVYTSATHANFSATPTVSARYSGRYKTGDAAAPISIAVEVCDVNVSMPIRSISNGRAVAQFRNSLILNNSRDADMRVAVYDLSGRLLAQTSVRPGVTAEMKMSNLSKGLYLVKAFAGSELIDTQSYVRQ